VTVRPRATSAAGHTLTFADGTDLDVDAVIWATGYGTDHSWLHAENASEGQIAHRRGVTEVPGLYFVGLEWQHTRGSALVGWVKDDAEFIADRLAAYARARAERADQSTQLAHTTGEKGFAHA
jgi:putative flavoprotein involved in K+ transport